MSLKIGIVGLPNVGKSTLFNALTKSNLAAAENYPFCTIEPNTGVVPVPDARLQKLADIVKTNVIIPATVEFVDIAGLVAGAHKGEGLGNQFLAHIREVDAIVMVVRAFADENIIHVSGAINPKRDIDIITLELILADLQTVDKLLNGLEKDRKSGDKTAVLQYKAIDLLKTALDDGKRADSVKLTDEEAEAIKHIQLMTLKPILYVGNVAEADVTKNPTDLGLPTEAMLISAKVEAELSALSDDEQVEYLASLGLNESGLTRLVHQAYETLGLQYYFTAGPKEVRAWTIHQGWLAPQAAGVIHTDFTKGFIRAEVMSYADLIAAGSEARVKEQGKLRIEGKEYVMREGDVVHFRVGG